MEIEELLPFMQTSLINDVSFKDFEEKYRFDENNLIDAGYFSKVYPINLNEKSLVGKFMRIKKGIKYNISGNLEDAAILNYEYGIQKELYDGKVKVSKPEDVFLVNELNSNFSFYGLVMQDLGRVTLGRLIGSTLEKAEEMRDIELEKAFDLGLAPCYDDFNSGNNAMWFEEQVYLIDFTFWRRREIK